MKVVFSEVVGEVERTLIQQFYEGLMRIEYDLREDDFRFSPTDAGKKAAQHLIAKRAGVER